MINGVSMPGERRTLFVVLALLGATAMAVFVLFPQAGLLTLAGFVVLGLFAVVAEVFRGDFDKIVLFWAAVFPLGSYAWFPKEHSIVTLERGIIFLGFCGLLLARRSTISPTPKALRRVGLACIAYIAVAAFTVTMTPDFLSSGRFLLDSFPVPLCFGWLILVWFNVRRHLPVLHTSVCIASVICASVAAAEIATGQDLIPIGGSEMFFAGGIARPNGPFASNDKLAVIGGVCLFLLLFLRVALGSAVSTTRRVIHFVGLTAAIGMSLMPMFRSVMLTLVLVLIIDTFWERRPSQRAWRATLLAAFIGLVLVVRVAMPDVFEDRSGSDNLYGRIAEYEQSFKVFLDHPLLGVGYNNFNGAVAGISRYRTSYEGVASLDWPHSNLNSVVVETGIIGFIPYAMMHIFLFLAFWQLRRVSASGRMVWKYYVYMMLTYWITGLTEACGTEPLNTIYTFALLVCYKYAATAPDAVFPEENRASSETLSRVSQYVRPYGPRGERSFSHAE